LMESTKSTGTIALAGVDLQGSTYPLMGL